MTPLHGADVAESLAAWLEALRTAGALQPPAAEWVPVEQARGRVTAGAVVAPRSTPGFDAAAMDGIAVAAADTAGAPLTLPSARFARVDTGDPLPGGVDAVVKREDVALGDGAALEQSVLPYLNVRQLGEDVAAGDLLLRPGRVLRPTDLAVLASVGETAVSVRRRPVVTIVPTGDELVPPGSDPAPGQLVDTNSLMLAAMAEEAGAEARRLPIVPDDPARLEEALRAAADGADLVLLLSGSAKGADDHAVAVVERVGRVVVQGVAVKPGHPVLLGVVGSTPLVGVPGYPVSATIAFELFAVPLLATLEGRVPTERPRARARAAVAMRSAPRSAEWMRLRLARVDGDLVAMPLRRGAGVLTSLARADGLTCVPIGSDGVAAGDELDVELLRPLAAIERTLVLAGSTDPLVDELAAVVDLAPDCEGSAAGAEALVAHRCHVALVERADVPAGAIVLGTRERELGLAVAPGNPLGIDGVASLRRPEVRLANRPRGSSSRRLLDELLEREGVDAEGVTGYRREARSHHAVAAAVEGGVADCGVVAASAARRHGLGFVPLARQELVLLAAASLVGDPRADLLRAAIASS